MFDCAAPRLVAPDEIAPVDNLPRSPITEVISRILHHYCGEKGRYARLTESQEQTVKMEE